MTDTWMPYAKRLAKGERAYFVVHGHTKSGVDVEYRKAASEIFSVTDKEICWQYLQNDPEEMQIEDAWIDFPESSERLGNYFIVPATLRWADTLTMAINFRGPDKYQDLKLEKYGGESS